MRHCSFIQQTTHMHINSMQQPRLPTYIYSTCNIYTCTYNCKHTNSPTYTNRYIHLVPLHLLITSYICHMFKVLIQNYTTCEGCMVVDAACTKYKLNSNKWGWVQDRLEGHPHPLSVEEQEVPCMQHLDRGNCSNREFPSTTPSGYQLNHTLPTYGTHQLEWRGRPNSSQMGQLSCCGLGNRSGSAVAVRQGALQLRDLHEDTTGPGRSGEGEDFPKYSCVLIELVSTTCQTIHNSLAGVEMSL